MPEITRTCSVCGGDSSSRLEGYSPEEWDLVKCSNCSFVYLKNPPGFDALEEEFAWETTYQEKKKSGGSTPFSGLSRRLRNARPVKRSLVERKIHRWFEVGNILDIGCGDVLRAPEPYTPFGIELSVGLHKAANEQMQARGGYCLQEPGSEGVWKFEEEFFEGAILHSYLEHEAEPNSVLSGLNRALKERGRVFVRVPNFASLNRRVVGKKWCGFRHPDHVNYFTPSTLRSIAKRNGFETKILNRANLWLNDNIIALLTKTQKPRTQS